VCRVYCLSSLASVTSLRPLASLLKLFPSFCSRNSSSIIICLQQHTLSFLQAWVASSSQERQGKETRLRKSSSRSSRRRRRITGHRARERERESIFGGSNGFSRVFIKHIRYTLAAHGFGTSLQSSKLQNLIQEKCGIW
jgi:hypothetical protein